MKYICPDCAREMTVDRIGVSVAIYAKAIGHKRPYEVFHADLHQCAECSKRVIAGFGDLPIWRHNYPEPVPNFDFASYERGMDLPTVSD